MVLTQTGGRIDAAVDLLQRHYNASLAVNDDYVPVPPSRTDLLNGNGINNQAPPALPPRDRSGSVQQQQQQHHVVGVSGLLMQDTPPPPPPPRSVMNPPPTPPRGTTPPPLPPPSSQQHQQGNHLGKQEKASVFWRSFVQSHNIYFLALI